MKNRKHVLILIIVLLCIFIPLTIIGYVNSSGIHVFDDNPTHEFYYDGYLWFYDDNDELLNKYECSTTTCDYATSSIDDDTYGINYYKDGTVNYIKLIDGRYAFIKDGAVVNLFDVSTGSTLTLNSVKTYNHTLSGNLYIVEYSNNLWGVISLSSSGMEAIIPFDYNFIGLIDDTDVNGYITTNTFIVQKNSKWYLVDSTNNAITFDTSYPIIDYTSSYIFTKNGTQIRIYSYEGREFVTDYIVRNYVISGNYIGIVTENEVVVYTQLGLDPLGSVSVTSSENISLNILDNSIEVLQNDNVVGSIDLS